MKNDWSVHEVAGVAHVVPNGENHTLDFECPCGWHYDGDVIVHHAYDEREKFERGNRRPS